MRKLLAVGLLMLLAVTVKAGERAEFANASGFATVDISSFQWCHIGADNQRVALMFDLIGTSTNSFRVLFSTVPAGGSVPTSTGTAGYTMYPTDPPWVVPIGFGVHCWGVSDGRSTDTLHYTEFRGR